MTVLILVLIFLVAILGCWYIATPAFRRRVADAFAKSPRDRTAICLGVAITALLVALMGTDSEFSRARHSLPDDILALLDTVVESGVLLSDDAETLNEWLNRYARTHQRNLERKIITVGSELPTATLQKIVDNIKLDTNDRLKLYRALARGLKNGTFYVYGEFGETLQPEDDMDIPKDIYVIMRAAANQEELSDRQRIRIGESLETGLHARFLAPGPPLRDSSPPDDEPLVDPSSGYDAAPEPPPAESPAPDR